MGTNRWIGPCRDRSLTSDGALASDVAGEIILELPRLAGNLLMTRIPQFL
jgi:hypothetical protein